MIEPSSDSSLSPPVEVEIILDEQPFGGGYRMIMQGYRLESGALIPVGERREVWRAASSRERDEFLVR